MDRNDLFDVLKLALWRQGTASADAEVFGELKAHAIHTLAAPVLSELSLSPELMKAWKSDIIFQAIRYQAYMTAQQSLPLTVPYVILKGTSAGRYYPFPEYRMMGDIDLLTRAEDYEAACQMMLEGGYEENMDEGALMRGRHRIFCRDGFTVEVHVLYASLNNPEKEKQFDKLILEHMDDTHVLPDLINGLTLLEHINQHLMEGLGLRQIIDWMLFVDKCLDNTAWPAFEELARKFGLKKLAVTVTRMCEIYLGLRTHAWTKRADEKLCAELMDYIFSCGDFGRKIDYKESLSVGRAAKLRHPILALRELQQRGVENWPRAKKPYFRPFAWMWQGRRFFKETDNLPGGYAAAAKKDRMIEALGVIGGKKRPK